MLLFSSLEKNQKKMSKSDDVIELYVFLRCRTRLYEKI